MGEWGVISLDQLYSMFPVLAQIMMKDVDMLLTVEQGRIHWGGPFWATPKLHKEGKNVAHVLANGQHFST